MTTRAAQEPVPDPAHRPVAWVVSPHDLVAQAVAEALRTSGAPAEFHAWEQLLGQADGDDGAGSTGTATHVMVILDGVDRPRAVEAVSRFVARGQARVAVVTSAPNALVWGGLLQGSSVDVVTVTTSVEQLTEMVRRFVSGDPLMDPERRKALRADWLEALDRRHHLLAQVRGLSRQQLRVLELLASGRRVPEVAEVMGIADGTVRSHVKTLRSKLGARTQLEAVAMLRQAHEVGETGEGGDAADLVPRPRAARTGRLGPLAAPLGSGA